MSAKESAGRVEDRSTGVSAAHNGAGLVRWSTSTPLIAVGVVAFVGWLLHLLDKLANPPQLIETGDSFTLVTLGHGPLGGYYWPIALLATTVGLWLWQQRSGLGSGPRAGFATRLQAGVAALMVVAGFVYLSGETFVPVGAILVVVGLRQRDRLVLAPGVVVLVAAVLEHAVVVSPIRRSQLEASGVALEIFYLVEAAVILAIGIAIHVVARGRGLSRTATDGSRDALAPQADEAAALDLLNTVGAVRSRVRADRHATSMPLLVLGAVMLIGGLLDLPIVTQRDQVVGDEIEIWTWISLWYWSAGLLVAIVGLWWWQRRQLARLGVGHGGGGWGLPVVFLLLLQLGWLPGFTPVTFDGIAVLSSFFGPVLVTGTALLAAGLYQRDRVLSRWGIGVTAFGVAQGAASLFIMSTLQPEQLMSIGETVGWVWLGLDLGLGVALLVAGGVARWRQS